MGSIVRPPVIRRTCHALATPVKRSFATDLSTAFRSSSSLRRPSQILASRQRPIHALQYREALLRSSRVATFHTSNKLSILPPGPQHLDGTINDPAPVPHTSPSHGSYHWTFERLIAASLIPLTVAPFAAGSLNPVTDAALCAALLIHSHIGFEALIIDYIPKKKLPKTRATFDWGLRAATLLVAVGLYEFETTDVGLTEGIRRVWTA